jgi:hypothetical protein
MFGTCNIKRGRKERNIEGRRELVRPDIGENRNWKCMDK